MFSRNRLKKKEWIDTLQKTNSENNGLNDDLKEKIAVMEAELAQLRRLMYEAGFSEDLIPRA